ncbi:response regulator [Arsukibacterium sp.]|uniref:response regulator n=1 Tax=Arsukibacterium sp. TaxID=1977258 RepID=UPI002FD8D68F
MQAKSLPQSALLVDDVSSVRQYLRQILQQAGVEHIFEASDGASAARLFNEHKPHWVFLDIQLPDINGQVLLQRFKQLDAQSQIVMVTAFSSVDNLKEAIAGGAKAFVVKPFSAERIISLLQPQLH